MKFLFLLLFVLLQVESSLACLAKAPLSVVEAMASGQVVPGKDCSELPSEQCVCFDGLDVTVSDVVDEKVNGEPVWSSKENVVDCETVEDCEALRCSHCSSLESYEFFYAENLILPGYEAYCSKITGYEQVLTGRKTLVENAEKKAAKNNKLAAEKAAKDLIDQGKKARESCQRVLDLIGGFNLLSGSAGSENADQMVSLFATAKQYLSDGRPGKARHAIQQIPVDGVLITQQMKDLALDQLKEYEAVE